MPQDKHHSLQILWYRRCKHKHQHPTTRQEITFSTYRVYFQNGKGKKYIASVLYCMRRDKHITSTCSCPASQYKRRCYHLDAIVGMMDDTIQEHKREDKGDKR